MSQLRIRSMVSATVSVLIVASITGCYDEKATPVSTDTSQPKTSEPLAPTKIILTETSLSFDPATCEPMSNTLPLGQGSARVDILGREGGECKFEYTFEVEGGYTVYRVSVPTGASPVEIHAKPGGYEVTTSFDLETAEVVRSGNLHFD